MPVTQLIGISLTVADLAGTSAFYRDALGFAIGDEKPLVDPAWYRLHGLETDTTARAVDVGIGHQTVQLVTFDPAGRPYPSERASNDQWFQHCALVCSDIAAAAKQLGGYRPGVITREAPVLLPPSTGGVSAFKFRDPEGHPLELIFFPDGVGAPNWHVRSETGILGYDHTAISVMDVDRSIAFYTGLLGFKIAGRTLNQGPEQDRLDGLTGCLVDVVALEPATIATPHVELLHYRTPPGRTLAADVNANDVASARQIHKVADLDALVARLQKEDVKFVSPGVVSLKDGSKAVSVRDPDGHMLVLLE